MLNPFISRHRIFLLICAGLFSLIIPGNLMAQWSSAHLTVARYQPCGATVGTKVLFAGGQVRYLQSTATVDIYDDSNGKWTTQTLSVPRFDLASATVGSKVFFGGGDNEAEYFDVVDIYDDATNSWSQDKLSVARGRLSAVSIGSKVIFAGGQQSGRYSTSDAVDIYDTKTKKWTLAKLSLRRFWLGAATVGSKAMFAGGQTERGGFSDVVDIYDDSNGSWTTHKLSLNRESLVATTIGSKILFAGGHSTQGESSVVDVYDNNTNTWSVYHLSTGRYDLAAVSHKGKAFFAGGHTTSGSVTSNVVDIYDGNTNTWTTTKLAVPRNSVAAAAVGNKVFFAGGWVSHRDTVTNLVDIYSLDLVKDSAPPTVVVELLNEGVTDHKGNVLVRIQVVDASPIVSVVINNLEMIKNETTTFDKELTLKSGQKVTITATDKHGLIKDIERIIEGKAAIASTTSTKRRYYSLLMAVEKYQDNGVQTLSYPITDANNLRNVLIKKYGFAKDDVTLLENPTSYEIDKAFEELRLKMTEEDLVLIFYAGHGYYDEASKIGYWLPSDALKENKARWFRNSALVEDIRAIPSKHTLLIADACFAGAIFKIRAPFNNASPAYYDMMKYSSRKAMTSGAMSVVPDNSVFAKYLIKILDENPNRYLDSEDLYHQIRESMKNNSDLIPQYGEINEAGDRGGVFVFERKGEN